MGLSPAIRAWTVRVAAMFVAACCFPSFSYGDGVIRDGLGAVSIGRGGTNIGFADNGQMILDNPAAMINVSGNGLFEFSIDTLFTDLNYQDPQNNANGVVKPYPMPQLAIIRRTPDQVFAYGVGVYAPAGFGAEYDIAHPAFGTTRSKSFGAIMKVLPSAAVLLTERLSIGGSLGVGVSHAELEGPFHLQSGAFAGNPTLLDVQATGAAPTWNLGLQYVLSENTTIGATYTGETRLKMDGNARATVPGLGSGGMDADVDLVWPRSLGVGISHKPREDRTIGLDVIWYDWSHAFNEVGMRFSNFSNPAFAAALGPIFQDALPLNWKDSISIRCGFEQRINDVNTIRFGYVYHDNPIPDTTLTYYIPATLQHAASIGWGRKICCWDFDMSYQFSWGQPRLVGNSAILGGDFNNSRMEASAHWMSFSFIRRF